MYSSDRVQFKRPDLSGLSKEHTVVDLHFHSNYSDGLHPISKIAAKARKLGIGIAITDHNEIRGALEIDGYADIFSIPGIEITATEGSHLLVYFYDTRELERFYIQDVAPFMGPGIMSSLRLPMADIIERARQYPCVIIFPHPYCAIFTGICNLQFSDSQLNELFQMVDGVEAINANNLNKWNLKCTVLGFNKDKAMVGGSDGHAITHMGRSVSYAPCPRTRKDFLDAVLAKRNQVTGKEIHFLQKMTANGRKLRSNWSNCPDLLEKNIGYGRKIINFKSRAIRSKVQRRLHTHLGIG